jgi:hypothetical protein
VPAKTEIRKSKDTVSAEVVESQEAFAPRIDVSYSCERDHQFSLTFAEDAAAPSHWDCPRCGQIALRQDGTAPTPPVVKPARSHWDRLLQRRTIPELEEMLAERLHELRGDE